MAEEKKENESKKKFDLKSILILVGAVFNGLVLLGSVVIVYLHTLGFNPPIIIEKELELLEKKRQKLILDSKNPFKDLPVELSDIPNFHPLVVPFEEVITNLNGLPQKMIKINLSFTVLDDFTYQEMMEPQFKTKIRDQIIKVLQSTEFSQIDSLQGKLLLKDILLKNINNVLNEGVIRDVHYTEFVVQ